VELFSQMLGQLLHDEPGAHIVYAARRNGNDHAHRPSRIGLRCHNSWDCGRCDCGTGKGQELTTNDLHGVLLILKVIVVAWSETTGPTSAGPHSNGTRV